MEIFYYNSPIGVLEIIVENFELISLKLTKDLLDSKDSEFSLNIKKQLKEYFAGERKSFDIKLNPKGTEFQKKVWAELVKIPYGKTISYKDLAEKIGNKNAQRAVGGACNKNPIFIIIPCHRVISANGKLTGFAYGTDLKQRLLDLEAILPS